MTVRSDLEKATGVKAKKNEDAAAFRLRLIEAVSGLDDEDYEALPKTSREWSDEAIKAYDTGRKLEDIPDFPAEDSSSKKTKAAAEEPEEEEEEEEQELDLEDETEEEGEEGTSTESDDAGDDAGDEDEDDEQEDEEVTHTDVAESTSRKRTAKSNKVTTKAAKGKNKKAVAAKSEKAAKPKKAKAASEGGKGLDFARSILAKDISVSATDLREKVAQAGYEVSDSTLSTGASGFRAAVRALQKAGKLKSNMLD
jgi:hypothetical protein